MTHSSVRPLSRLSLFALDYSNGTPIARIPFYTEIEVTQSKSEMLPEDRFNKTIEAVIEEFEVECFEDLACRQRIVSFLRRLLSNLWPEDIRNQLVADQQLAWETIEEIIQYVRNIVGEGGFPHVPDEDIQKYLEEAIKVYSEEHGIPIVEPDGDRTPFTWAFPLGVLATDHVGYLSYDLTRLPQNIYDAVYQAVDERRRNVGNGNVSIWAYPMALDQDRIEVLAQGRISDELIMAKLEIARPFLPGNLLAFNLPAMQNPGLVDWRISPGSFATTPGLLVGEDGCETMLPSNVAQQEFYFRQIVRLTEDELDIGDGDEVSIPEKLTGKVRFGLVNEYKVAWYPIGHSLGQIQYSLPLAPGESVNLAIIDWSREDAGTRTEDTTVSEQLVHQQHRDRLITETVNAALGEWQRGGSIMAGHAASAGASVPLGVVSIAAGVADAIGGSYSTSSGNRGITADTVQKLSDNIAQASSSMRDLRSTVVVQHKQQEQETIETRTVVNYNHSHALTILYYEVLRHFRLVTQLVARRPALLVKAEELDLVEIDDKKEQVETLSNVALLNKKLLAGNLLDNSFNSGFEAITRQKKQKRLQELRSSTYEVDLEFVYFYISIKTGGIANQEVEIRDGHIYKDQDTTSTRLLHTTNTPGTDEEVLQIEGSFDNEQRAYMMFVRAENPKEAVWSKIFAINIRLAGLHDKNKAFSVTEIIINGRTQDGVERPLVHWTGDHKFFNDTSLRLPVNPPPPRPGKTEEDFNDHISIEELAQHLHDHSTYYNRVLWLNEPDYQRAKRFDSQDYQWDNRTTLLDHIENRPLEVLTDYVAFPTTDTHIRQAILELSNKADDLDALHERLVALPTRGVFAEAKLGNCNASEFIDDTRFWDWQKSLIPHMAPEIAAVQPVTPQSQPLNITPTNFPSPIVNITNPPNAPDPSGLADVLKVLGTPNIFRDMSGREEVADLLKKLSDNTIKIADAANKAREIQNKYGADLLKASAPAVSSTPASHSATPATSQKSPIQEAHQTQQHLDRQKQKGNITPEQHAKLSEQNHERIVPQKSSPTKTITPPTPKSGSIKPHLPDKLPNDGLFFQIFFHRVDRTVPTGTANINIKAVGQAESISHRKLENGSIYYHAKAVNTPGSVTITVDYDDNSVDDVIADAIGKAGTGLPVKSIQHRFNGGPHDYSIPAVGNVIKINVIPTVTAITKKTSSKQSAIESAKAEIGMSAEIIDIKLTGESKTGVEKGEEYEYKIFYLTGGLDFPDKV